MEKMTRNVMSVSKIPVSGGSRGGKEKLIERNNKKIIKKHQRKGEIGQNQDIVFNEVPRISGRRRWNKSSKQENNREIKKSKEASTRQRVG